MLDFNGVKFHWLGHDGYRIIAGDKTIYIDPYQLSKAQQNRNDADILLISHNHFDHLSMDDIKNVLGKKTSIVAAKECIDQLKGAGAAEIKEVAPGDRMTVQGVSIEAVAAYNINKKFHPKADRKVGFVITAGNMRIYHTGDTDDLDYIEKLLDTGCWIGMDRYGLDLWVTTPRGSGPARVGFAEPCTRPDGLRT